MDYTEHYDSPLGGITLACDGEALTGLWFDDPKRHPAEPDRPAEAGTIPVLEETKQWLDLYFSGRDPGFTPKLKTQGTAFRKVVWEILLTIPYGKTVTYGEVAERAARQMHLPRMSAQAVGGAVGHNAIALIIPCHRVIGANGALTGYAAGLERKKMLLEMEKGKDSSSSAQNGTEGRLQNDTKREIKQARFNSNRA